MKNVLIMLAVATCPVVAGGCNCCGLGACPCNPLNWFNRGAYCGPTTPTYAPLVSGPVTAPAIMPQYATPFAAPLASAPMGAPMIADPSMLGYVQPQAMGAEPGCAYVEPGCGYMGATVGYGPAMPMGYGGMDASCCETGMYDGAVISEPSQPYTPEPTPGE